MDLSLFYLAVAMARTIYRAIPHGRTTDREISEFAKLIGAPPTLPIRKRCVEGDVAGGEVEPLDELIRLPRAGFALHADVFPFDA